MKLQISLRGLNGSFTVFQIPPFEILWFGNQYVAGDVGRGWGWGLVRGPRVHFFILFFFYADHPLQGFRSHCCVRGYSSLLVATAGAEATTRTGRQHTHAHTHTLNPQLNPLLPPNMT